MSLIKFYEKKIYISSLFIDDDISEDFVKWLRLHPGNMYHKSIIYRIYAKDRYNTVVNIPGEKCGDPRTKILFRVNDITIDVIDFTKKQRFQGTFDNFCKLLM